MLEKLSAINKIAKLQSQSNNTKTFNANLPILLKVLAKNKGDEYLLKLGNATIQTKSPIALEVGKTYWANMHKNSAGQIVLHNLTLQPLFVSHLKDMPLKLSFEDLALLQHDPKAFVAELKDFLLTQLSCAQSRDEFSQLSSLIFSLQQGVISLVISDEGKEHLIQIAPKSQYIDFYAVFPHLGPIDGRIYTQDNAKNKGIVAQFGVMNEKIQKILQDHAELLGFENVTIPQ